MTRLQIAIVLAVVAIAIGAIGLAGRRVEARDRRAVHAAFAQGKAQRLEVAAQELGNDIEKIGEDLELGLALASATDDPGQLGREFHAIATITREYMGFELRADDDRAVLRVEAPDAVPGTMDRLRASIGETVEAARAHPGALRMSRAVADEPWLRVFARRIAGDNVHRLTAAVVVDTRPILAKLRLLRDPDSALLVLGAYGAPAPSSDQAVARAAVATPPDLPAFARFVAASRHQAVVATLDEHEAQALGLPAAPAVAVAVPALVEDGDPWTLALIASTAALRSQEQTIVRRMAVGVGLLGAVLIVIAVYVLRSARRAAALRERLRHADRLAHLSEKAEKILDHIPSDVAALSGDRRITAVNARLRQRLGDVVGRPLSALLEAAPADERAAIEALLGDAAQSGAVATIHLERFSLFGNPARSTVHAVSLERRLPDVYTLLVADDLGAVQRLEGQLLHSEKLATAGVLSAGIAHEIGTPLNIARGRAELALARLGDDHPQAASQRLIMEQIDHVTGLIGQLLDFVSPRAIAVQPVDARAALLAGAGLLGAEAQRRGVALAVDASAELPPLLADPGQLQQVLINLTMNALDACARGGQVTLRARAAGARVSIEVADDGAGIPRAIRNQIFDPFFTTKKRGRGTGLGLSIVDQLVRSHHGELEVDSEPGAGTVVRVAWPAAAARGKESS